MSVLSPDQKDPTSLEMAMAPMDEAISQLDAVLSDLKSSTSSLVVDKNQQAIGLRRYFVNLAGYNPNLYTKNEARKIAKSGRNIAIASALAAKALGFLSGTSVAALNTLEKGVNDPATLAGAAALLGISYYLFSKVMDGDLFEKARSKVMNDTGHLYREYHAAAGDFKKQEGIRKKINSLTHGGKWLSFETARVGGAYLSAAVTLGSVLLWFYRAEIDAKTAAEISEANQIITNELEDNFKALEEKRVEAETAVSAVTDKLGGQAFSLSTEQTVEIEPLKERLAVAQEKYDTTAQAIQKEQDGIGKTGKVGRGPEYRAMLADQKSLGNRIGVLNADIKSFEGDIDQVRVQAQASASQAFDNQREGLQAQLDAAKARLGQAQGAENSARNIDALAQQDRRYVGVNEVAGVDARVGALFESLYESHPATLVGVAAVGTWIWLLETSFLRGIRADVSELELREIDYAAEVIKKDALILDVEAQIRAVKAEKRLVLLTHAQSTSEEVRTGLSSASQTAADKQINATLKELDAIQDERMEIILEAMQKIQDAVNDPSITSLDAEQKARFGTVVQGMTTDFLNRVRDENKPVANENREPVSVGQNQNGSVPSVP